MEIQKIKDKGRLVMHNEKNYNGIDIVKLFMAICVVIIHLKPFGILGETANFILSEVMVRAAVPFFFCASGFFLKGKLNKTCNNREYKAVIYSFVKRIFQLYIIWTVIYLPPSFFWIKIEGKSIIRYIQECVFDGSYIHLWFLPSLIVATVFVAFLVKKIGEKRTLLITLVLYLIGLWDTSYVGFMHNRVVLNIIEKYDDIFITTRNGIFFGAIFVLLGFMARERQCEVKKEILFLIVSVMGLFAEMFMLKIFSTPKIYDNILFCIPVTYFLFMIAKSIKCKDSDIYIQIRKMGVLIWLSHCWIDFTYSIWCYNILHVSGNAIMRFVYTIVLAVGFSTIVIILQKRKKFSWLNKIY